jgi:hypothetical protein
MARRFSGQGGLFEARCCQWTGPPALAAQPLAPLCRARAGCGAQQQGGLAPPLRIDADLPGLQQRRGAAARIERWCQLEQKLPARG